jgi:hypothetical protein
MCLALVDERAPGQGRAGAPVVLRAPIGGPRTPGPLLSDRSWAVSSYRPDVDALAAAPARVVIAVGEESLGTFTGRSAVATAELLGQQATVFPSHHGGFLGGEFGYAGQPEALRTQAARRPRRRQLTAAHLASEMRAPRTCSPSLNPERRRRVRPDGTHHRVLGRRSRHRTRMTSAPDSPLAELLSQRPLESVDPSRDTHRSPAERNRASTLTSEAPKCRDGAARIPTFLRSGPLPSRADGERYRPAMLHISHHERVEGHPHRWHVFLHGRDQPIPVELDPEERRSLELTDEEIHDRLPTALERHYTENRDDLIMVPGEQYNEASWDAPVRLEQNHFV